MFLHGFSMILGFSRNVNAVQRIEQIELNVRNSVRGGRKFDIKICWSLFCLRFCGIEMCRPARG